MTSGRSFGAIISANRRHRQQFDSVTRALIINEKSKGRSYRDVASEFNTTPSTIFGIYQRWKHNKTIERKPNRGRKPKLTKAEIKYVILSLKRDRRITYDALVGVVGGKVSRSTIKRIVRTYYGRKWRAMQRIPLSKETAAQRLSWAQAWREDIDELIEVRGSKVRASFWFSKGSPH